MAVVTVLTGHTSPETAYVVNDYPYGFRLRCKIRYWVETKPGHGQQCVSQTTNPKLSVEKWNTPKASTYSVVKILYLDEQGYVQHQGLYGGSSVEKIKQFIAEFGEHFTPDQVKRANNEVLFAQTMEKRYAGASAAFVKSA